MSGLHGHIIIAASKVVSETAEVLGEILQAIGTQPFLVPAVFGTEGGDSALKMPLPPSSFLRRIRGLSPGVEEELPPDQRNYKDHEEMSERLAKLAPKEDNRSLA